MHDVITVGSSTIDVFAHTEAELITIRKADGEEDLIAYPSGTKIVVKKLQFMVGGGGTNTAVSFARLGFRTAWLSKLGRDENGERIISEMRKEKVDFIGPRSDGLSGYSIILDSIAHDRTILTYKGVNDDLSPEEIKPSLIDAKWLYFSSMMGKGYESLERIAAIAQKKGIPYAFNPSSYLCSKGRQYMDKLISGASLLVLNREEAETLVGKAERVTLAQNLRALGPKNVVITDGPDEIVCLYGDHAYLMTPRKVKVVESTGAGDAFASSFLAGIIKTNDPIFSLKLAAVNCESVLSYVGAKNILLTWNQAARAIAKGKFQIRKIVPKS